MLPGASSGPREPLARRNRMVLLSFALTND